MNILAINNFKFNAPFKANNSSNNVIATPKFDLRMAQPLTQDTVSFKAYAQTRKISGDLKGACSATTAKNIIKKHLDAHNKNIELFTSKFGDKLAFIERLKSEFSLQLKTASLGIGNQKISEIMNTISDVSGFCFVLKKPDDYNYFIKTFSDMIKHGEVNPIEVEYHRLPDIYKKGQVEKSFNSLDPSKSQKLKNTIYNVKNPTYQLWKDVDSRSGYSGLHITIKNADSTKSEIQVMTRAMADLKHYENLYYKGRNGKPLNPKYKILEPILLPIKPKDPENLTPEEMFIQKALTKYTQEAYTERLDNPFETNRPFLKVADSKTLTAKEKEMLEPYDFNKIKVLVDACDQYAKK